MDSLKYITASIVETLFRLFPFSARTGIVRIGKPDRNSPVFLTGNFDLGLRRVKRAMKGLDAWLLVANTRGINVWCASTGGHFTNHEVISVIKTSGIEELVHHKQVVLPQLAATGIQGKDVFKKTGWKVIWGPVYAESIPEFVKENFSKTTEMRKVKFGFGERMEMAVMWAFPLSLVFSAVLYFWKPELLLAMNLLHWGLAFFLYAFFPFYAKMLKPQKQGLKFNAFTMVIDILKLPIFFWLLFMAGLVVWHTYSYGSENLAASVSGFWTTWAISSFLIILLLCIDLMGTTPVYKSSLQKERFFRISLNEENCKGAGFCETVCPENCFDVDYAGKTATIPRMNDCVQCGACIVQCPFDALEFENAAGEIITPENVRKFKLDLMGERGTKKN